MSTLTKQTILRLTCEKEHFDAVIAFGYGPVQSRATPTSYQVDLYGRINAIATGMLYQNLNIRQIIPTGGKTGGLDKPSEAALMAGIIQSKFDIPASVFLLEEEAMDTIFNLIYVANIIDSSPQFYQNLLFVAMEFHLPRIQEICSIIGFQGTFVAAESIVKLRSKHHQNFLHQLLQPNNPSYTILLNNQERGIRGIRKLPEYWIPPLGMLKNTQCLRKILAIERIQPFLNSHHIDVNSLADESLYNMIHSIPRQFPN